MKKYFVTFLLALAGALSACLSLAGCKEAVVIPGVYKLYSAKLNLNGEKIEIKVGDEYMGETVTEEYIVLTLNEDKTYEMFTFGMTGTGTWEEKDGELKFNSDVSGDFTVTKNGNTIVMSMPYGFSGEIEYTLRKIK